LFIQILNSVPDEENADVAGTSAIPNSTGIQPNEPVTDRMVEQLLDTIPAMVNAIIYYMRW